MPLESFIPQARDLTRDEVFLLECLLDHSAPEDRERFTAQILRASVVGRCECGCPTLFLALDGKTAPTESVSKNQPPSALRRPSGAEEGEAAHSDRIRAADVGEGLPPPPTKKLRA